MKNRFHARVVLINLIFIYLCQLTTFAQFSDIKFDRLTIDDGLSQNTIVSIAQDDQGFIWVGTQDGFNKFDGYEFTTYTNNLNNPNTLIHNYVTAVSHYGNNQLVVGTIGGLDLFNLKHETFTHFRAGDGIGQLSANDINCTLTDSQSVLWVGTTGGLDKIDTLGGSVEHFTHDPNDMQSISNNSITVIFEDSNHDLWVGTEYGLNRLSGNNGRGFKRYYQDDRPFSISNNFITAIYEDKDGKIWIGTKDGLNRYQPESDGFEVFKTTADRKSISDNRITAILQDSRGVFWVGTQNGLNKLEESNGQLVFHVYKNEESDRSSLSNNWVTFLFEDRSRVLWVGTYFGGLNKHDLHTAKFKTLRHKEHNPQSLSSNIVRAIVKDSEGNVWVGAHPGLNKIDMKTGQITRFFHDVNDPNSISGNIVRGLCFDRDGILWIGTSDGGLNHYNPKTGKFSKVESNSDSSYTFKGNDVRLIYEDKDGVMWIGSNGEGLYRYERETGRFINYRPDTTKGNSISSLLVNYAITEDHDGNLWIGTWDGLNMLDKKTGMWKCYNHDPLNPESLSDNYVKSVLVDHNNIIWAATAGRGLNKLIDREKGVFEHYSVNDGLANNHTYGILEDANHYLWISTNKGLSRLDPDKKSFRNYDQNDGLQGNEFNTGSFYKAPDGELFFGGINGLTYFTPEDVKDNQNLPQVKITELLIFNNTIGLRDSSKGLYLDTHISFMDNINLTYKQNSVSFAFTGLHFSNPSKNQYAYFLEGFDNEWVYTTGNKRFANYTNLPPGKYVFKVKASNNDGVWQTVPAELGLIITPPFWQTWWFKLISLVSLIALVVGVHRYRVYRIKEQKKKLEYLVDERTAEIDRKSRLLQEKNKKIVTAHELLQLKQEEILARNDEILAQNDEILAQNEELEMQRRELERSYRNIRIISEIGREIASMLDFEKIILKVHEHVNNLMDATEFGIGIYNKEKRIIDFALYIYEGERIAGFKDSINSPRFTSWSVKNRKSVWLGDIQSEYKDYLPTIEGFKGNLLKSLICIPLIVEGRTVGVLSVQSPRKNNYSQYQFDLLNALATYIAIGLDNSNAYKTLESKVNERTKDLNKAYKELVETNKNFDEFAYRSAHDLRGPLARILGLCHLGQLEVKDKKGIKFLTFLEKVAFEMDHMLGRLLRTHQNKKTPVTKGFIDIKQVIGDIMKSISKTEDLQKVKFEYDIADNVQMESDPTLFRILLENVILNAVQFQDPEQNDKWVKVKIEKRENNGSQQAVITVTDNGIGIPKQQRNRVFDMFFVGSEASKGSGLGLYESKLIIDRLGGEIVINDQDESQTAIEIVLNQ